MINDYFNTFVNYWFFTHNESIYHLDGDYLQHFCHETAIPPAAFVLFLIN